MNSLHHMVVSGKVLYLGISDTPAWLVVKCNDYGTSKSKDGTTMHSRHGCLTDTSRPRL